MPSSDDTITLASGPLAAAERVEVSVPRQLGPVRLTREIGRGGMGVVFLGRHEILARDVAVKFLLNATPSQEDPAFKQFMTGARAAAVARHEGLTVVHHADCIENVPYLVMEYVDGPTVREVLKECGAFSLADTIAVLDQTADAVGELHDHGIVHRDIKTSNLLFDESGRVFVTDFGLAFMRSVRTGSGTTAVAVGTAAYMAPEAFDGVVSTYTDVYALGITAFELLTGDVPHAGSLEEIREKHRNETLPTQTLEELKLGRSFINLLERATHKNPLFRYKTARHFRRALAEAAGDHGVTPADQHHLANLVKKCRRNALDNTARDPTPTRSSSYLEALATLADDKRRSQATRNRNQVEPDVQTPPPKAEDELFGDLDCVQCGYNLRTQSARGGTCPECGTPTTASSNLDGYLEWRADGGNPEWLRRQRTQLRIIGWTASALIILFIVWIAVREFLP